MRLYLNIAVLEGLDIKATGKNVVRTSCVRSCGRVGPPTAMGGIGRRLLLAVGVRRGAHSLSTMHRRRHVLSDIGLWR